MKQNLLIAFFLTIAVGLSAQFDATNYSIAFLTKDVDDSGVLEEQGLIDDLRSRGFEVDVTYNDPGDITVTPDFDFSYAALEDYDLVVLGRGVSSGDFQDAEDWAAVTTPIVTFSAYLMRSSRLKLINSSSASREVADGTTVDMNRVTNADITSTHPVLTGLNADMDDQIGYLTWFYDYIAYGRDTFEMNHNATLLASLNHPGGPGDGTVAMAHWAAGVETYPGGVTLAGQRATFLMGSDDSSTPKIRNYTAFTSESTIAFHNLIKQLLGETPDGIEIPVLFDANNFRIAFLTKDVTPDGVLEEQGLISDLRQRGFDVDVTYNDPGDITVTPDFDFSYAALEDYDLVILGRGVSSGDFTDAEDWAAVTTPIITFSAYLMRSTRLKLINSSSASREVADGTTVDMNRITNVDITTGHSVFNGVDTDMNGEIEYLTWFYDYIAYGRDTFEMNHNATLLASLNHPGADGDGTVAMAHWDAGVETYPGGVTLAGPRATFLMGSDDSSTPKLRNYTAFTSESTIAFHNLIQQLLGFEPSGVEIPFSGPAARYSMEGTGDAVSDGVGAANGTIMNGNGITRESCGINNSINFAGATKLDAVIWVDDSPAIDFDGSSSFAISLWAKIDPFANVAEMTLLLKGDNKNDGSHLPNGNGHWYTIATKDNELRFALDDDVTKTQLGVAIDATNFPANEWNHIVGVVDVVQDSLFLYLNGVQIGSLLNETDMDMSTTGLPLVIGNYHSGVRRINGALDEVEIYDRVLSPTAIADMYANTSPTDACTVVETILEISDDATLSSLTVDVGTLTPAFDPAVPNYTLVAPAGTTEVTIGATTNFPAATLVGDGVFSNLPGTATVSVTAEDGTTVKDYSISISIEGQGNAKIVVDPGFGTLYDAIIAANSGDTLVLKNGESYSPLENYQIGKNIVIIAETIPTLPGLENMPIIDNIFGVSPIFQMNFGGNLVLIGIDVNGGGAANIIDCQGDLGVPTTQSIYINRCRLHNSTEDILNEARDGNVDMTTLESCIVRNTFVYDSGAGHGFYVKNYHGESTFIFENITFWNIGQQFNWMRHYPAGINQSFVYDHLTGYNLSTDVGQNKEIFGNSSAATEAGLDITLKNSLFHTQVSTNEGSLKFDNTAEIGSVTTNNNVLFQLQPIFDIGGTINHFDNQEGVDPQFQDPDNGDFTVLNDALWTAADDGEIIGATYWLPNFVDDFSDLNPTATDDLAVLKIALKAFPNPINDITYFSFHLEEGADVNLKIYDLMGREIQTVVNARLASGDHTLEVPTEHLQNGVYVYRFVSNGVLIANKLIKNSK